MADRHHLERLSRELIDKGRLIEAGWISLRLAAIPDRASPEQLDQMRMAFFAGAQHLFGSIMTALEPGTEPTPNDMRRMDLIDDELKSFIKDFEARSLPTKGTA